MLPERSELPEQNYLPSSAVMSYCECLVAVGWEPYTWLATPSCNVTLR